MNLAYWLNSVWMLSCRREAGAFAAATHVVAKTQWTVLEKILTANANSDVGRRHQFESIRSVSDFQQRVPIATPNHFSEAIGEIAAGRANVLTCEPVVLLEPTSGSTAGERLVPYTTSLRRQFQRAVACWVFDAMKHRPGIRRGRAYWSISPAMGPRRTSSGGIPIGFDDDAAYLSTVERCFLEHLLVMPRGIADFTSIENFRYCTLLHLLSAGDLSLISVWSPTFLTSLLEQIEPWRDRLAEDLRTGCATLPVADDAGKSSATMNISCSAKRAAELCDHLGANDSLSTMLGQIWPQLDLISCWADGTASNYVAQIQEYFPNVTIQPKGLMSTEACVSIPLVGHRGAALALRSHFFEFIPESEADSAAPTVLEAHELQEGQNYFILLTTSSGLYRYNIFDVVRCTGFFETTPLLTFLHKGAHISSITGEKITESQVVSAVRQASANSNIAVAQFTVTPQWGQPPGYRLLLNLEQQLSSAQVQELTNLCDCELGRQNCEYADKRSTGRLAPMCGEIRPAHEWSRLQKNRLSASGGSIEQYKHPFLVPDSKFEGKLQRLMSSDD